MRELALRVPADATEEVLDILLPLAPHGVAEIPRGDAVELRVRGAEAEVPSRDAVLAAGRRFGASLSEREVPDDWHERRLADYEPVVIADRLVVRPGWAPAPAPPLLDVVLADDSSFGAGTHPTTRMCLEALCEVDPAGAALDLGCGSGVLAIAAALLGWDPVVAVDSQPEAAAAALANARRSGVELDVRQSDVADAAGVAAALVMGNVPMAAHRAIATALGPPPPLLFASGVKAEQADDCAGLYAPAGLAEARRVAGSGWAMLTLAESRTM
jgi:ribosomal protein L11 methyltransferase